MCAEFIAVQPEPADPLVPPLAELEDFPETPERSEPSGPAELPMASGVGSWPGTDVRGCLGEVRELLGDGHLPYLVELPDRGPGADLIGRTAGLLVDLPVDLQPSGWRFVDRPGRDAARTAALWREDIDVLAEVFDGYAGDLKVQVCGPWTLGAGLWLPRGERILVDAGARRELVASLAQGVRDHLALVRRAVPGARLVVQLDEPSLPAVLAGRLPTDSGYGRIPAVETEEAISGLRAVLSAADGAETLMHSCATDAPIGLMRAAGPGGLSVDTTVIGRRGWESLAVAVEDGLRLYAGEVGGLGHVAAGDPGSGRTALTAQWDQLGLDVTLLRRVVVTPTCGLAGESRADARARQRACLDAAARLRDTVG